jgi:hypothetical protein
MRLKRKRLFGWRRTGAEGLEVEYKTSCAEKEVMREVVEQRERQMVCKHMESLKCG